MTPTEVAVIGAGIVGLATAHTLARRGVSVTVYEQGQAGAGQSAGQSRLFRHAHDDKRMIDLAIAARAGWADCEDDFGTELIAKDGTLALGVAVPGKLARLQQFLAVRARPIDTAELAERLPVLAPFDGPAMFDPDGGAIRTRAVIAALRDRLLCPIAAEQVLSIDHTGAEVEVRSATGARGSGGSSSAPVAAPRRWGRRRGIHPGGRVGPCPGVLRRARGRAGATGGPAGRRRIRRRHRDLRDRPLLPLRLGCAYQHHGAGDLRITSSTPGVSAAARSSGIDAAASGTTVPEAARVPAWPPELHPAARTQTVSTVAAVRIRGWSRKCLRSTS